MRTYASIRGALDLDSPPMRLYQKSKRLGIWDPHDIDFSGDAVAWQELTADERDLLVRVTALFQAGEEAVTVDLLPLVDAIGAEGRLENGLFLTAWLWEEGKHTEFFRRFLDEVVGETTDLHHLHGDAYRRIFGEELPRAMNALRADRSPAAVANAVVTYTMIVEGVLAETGYHGYFTALERAGLLTGLRDGLGLVKRDESRHIAYGVYLISRLVQEDPGSGPRSRREWRSSCRSRSRSSTRRSRPTIRCRSTSISASSSHSRPTSTRSGSRGSSERAQESRWSSRTIGGRSDCRGS